MSCKYNNCKHCGYKSECEIYKENAELKEVHESDKRSLRLIAEKGAELEEKISILLSCKNCPENKGGYICQKEYEDKCLAQKIQYIKELKEENAELKNQIEKMKCCENCAKNGHICVAEEMQGKLCGKNKVKWQLRR